MTASAARGGGLSRRKKVVFTAVTALLVGALFELSSLAALHVARALRPEHFVHGFVDMYFDGLTEEDRTSHLEGGWHPVLGWDNPPGVQYDWKNTVDQPYRVSYDARGARADDLPPKAELIATYGDSFTWCDEVSDHETWQVDLEERLGGEVRNYGVGAYGTGQAVLKVKEHLGRGEVAPITVLGILEENVNRVVNSYRPFYNQHTGVKLGFKPWFRRGPDGRIAMSPSVYDDRDLSLDELRRRAHELASDEYWMAANEKLEIRFPYTVQLVRTVVFLGSNKIRAMAGLPFGPEEADLWSEPDGLDVMHHLVDEFVASTTEAGSAPVVLLLPTGSTLREGTAPAYADFATQLASRHPDLVVVDVLAHDFDRSRFQVKPFVGHASPYGNRVISGILEAELRDSPLAERLPGLGGRAAGAP